MESFMNAPVGVRAEEAGDAGSSFVPHPTRSIPARAAVGNRSADITFALNNGTPSVHRSTRAGSFAKLRTAKNGCATSNRSAKIAGGAQNFPVRFMRARALTEAAAGLYPAAMHSGSAQRMPASTKSKSKAIVRVGPAGWSYPDWAGYVYPSRRQKGFHEATYLAEYFDTIEINSSFYNPFRPDHAAQWIERVAANPRFVFTAKLWQRFTHDISPGAESPAIAAATAEDERAVRAGFDVLHAAGKLSAVLLQFPFSFHRTRETVAHLSALLKRFADYPLVVELRHASWQTAETFAMLREAGAGFCNIDQPIIGRSLEPSAEATSPVGYVRLHGR